MTRRPHFTDYPQQPQSQASVLDQIHELKAWANRLGLYDAADYLERALEKDTF